MKFRFSKRFRRSIKKIAKRGYDFKDIEIFLDCVCDDKLPAKYKDHALKGKWIGHRECHIQGDWLLVYRFEGDTLVLVDTGSHADIFGM